MKTEVYSWRISPSLKADLERLARRRKLKISQVLDAAVRDWLANNAADVASDEEQKRLHAIASRLVGKISSGNRHGSSTVRQTVRKRLAQKYGQ